MSSVACETSACAALEALGERSDLLLGGPGALVGLPGLVLGELDELVGLQGLLVRGMGEPSDLFLLGPEPLGDL